MTKPMAMVFISMLMELNTKVNGRTTYKMDMVLKHGPMALAMKDTTRAERSMAMVLTHGLMVPSMLEIGLKIKSQDKYLSTVYFYNLGSLYLD